MPAAARTAVSALFRLDEQLGALVARADQLAIGQMRLTWWHDALRTLHGVRPSDPILVALRDASAIDAARLLPMIDGWEQLLEPLPLSEAALADFAEQRGATLFDTIGVRLGGAPEACRQAGRLWALVDLAYRISDRTTAECALMLAPPMPTGLPAALRVLAALAEHDRARGLDRPRRQGSPTRVLRAMLAGAGLG